MVKAPGQRIGAIGSTPGSVRIDKSKNDLSVTCSKEGYQTASVVHSALFNGATFGNLVAGGVIGVLVDASSGANFSYPSDIRLDLSPQVASIPPVAARGAFAPAATDEVQSSGPPIIRAATAPRVYQGALPPLTGALSR